MVSEMDIFEHFNGKISLVPPWQPVIYSDFDKIHMKHRGLLNKKKFQISSPTPHSPPPIICWWILYVAIATRVRIGLKNNNIIHVEANVINKYRKCKVSASSPLMVSEKKGL